MAKETNLTAWLEKPFQPNIGNGGDAQERIARAAEYSAYQLFQINRKLTELRNSVEGVTATLATLDLTGRR
jgi:hypothetical protein